MGKTKVEISKHKEIIEKYNQGISSTQIAKEYGVNSQTILNLLDRYKITKRPSANVKPCLKEKECTSCHNIFPYTNEYFTYKGKTYLDGSRKLRATCKKCSNNYTVSRFRERKKTDIDFRIRKAYSSRIRRALSFTGRKKAGITVELLGCSIKEFRNHLEIRFKPNMSWDNYGQWHIDHVKPCSAFDLTKEDQQRECFHFSNLQPLWANENANKSSWYDGRKF